MVVFRVCVLQLDVTNAKEMEAVVNFIQMHEGEEGK